MRYSTYNAIPQYPKSKKHPYETLEKSGEMWVFERCKNEKSDGSDGFGWAGKKTDPADPVGEKEGICRRRDRLCGDEKQDWGM